MSGFGERERERKREEMSVWGSWQDDDDEEETFSYIIMRLSNEGGRERKGGRKLGLLHAKDTHTHTEKVCAWMHEAKYVNGG